MAYTSRQIIDFLLLNPSMSDADIVTAMETYKISPAQMAEAVGLKEGEVAARVGAAIPPNQAVLLGDTYVQAVNQVTGSGEDQQVGGLENVITYKASDNKVGGDINFYSPTGEFQQTTKQQEVNATKDFLKFAAITGAGLYGLGGLGAGTGTTFAGEALADAGLLSGVGGLTSGALNAGGLSTVAGMGGAGGLTVGAGGLTGLTTGAGGLTGLTTVGGLTGANTLLGGTLLGSTLG